MENILFYNFSLKNKFERLIKNISKNFLLFNKIHFKLKKYFNCPRSPTDVKYFYNNGFLKNYFINLVLPFLKGV